MKLLFCGASSEIGASCIFLELDGKKILLDSGIRLSGEPLPEFKLIQEQNGFDCIIVSHAHTDHTGSLPVISNEYPDAPIFMTHPTKDITKVLLHDSLKLMKFRESEIPIFAENDVLNMLSKIKCHNFCNPFKPFSDADITVTFYSAGHIAGAACVFIQGNEGSIFYTGDFSITPQKTVGKADIQKLRPDILITESTYGDRLHSSRKVEEDKLIEMVKMVYERGGKILIPAFAVGRAQEVILILRSAIRKKQLPEMPIYVDGMIREICKVYKNHPNYLKPELAKRIWKEKDVFYSDNVISVSTQQQREEIVSKDEPCCVISSSGMLTGGYSVFYAEKFAGSEKNYIAITGYQDEESPGRALLEMSEKKEKTWRVNGKNLVLKCDFAKYSLSAHADKTEIFGVLERLQPRKIFLIHGNINVLEKLGKELGKQQTEKYREIYIPKNGDSYNINFKTPRKQLEKEKLFSLNKEKLPLTEELKDFNEVLLNQNNQKNLFGYTTEELMYIWSGKNDFSEEEIISFQIKLNKSTHFENVERKLFLFIPTKKNSKTKKDDGVMEVNKLSEFINEVFPKNARLLKNSFKIQEKIVILNFSFPNKIKDLFEEEIKTIELRSGWKVEINLNPNNIDIENLIREFLAENEDSIKKIAFHLNENKVKVNLFQILEKLEEIEVQFYEQIGIYLVFDYPEKITTNVSSIKEDKKYDQTSACSLIERVFDKAEDKIYRKSVKTKDGMQYIELSFITSVIGNKYIDWIKDLEKELDWEITIAPNSNQNEIMKIINNVLRTEKLVSKKNPSVIEATKSIKIKTTDVILSETINKISEVIFNKTGFKVEVD